MYGMRGGPLPRGGRLTALLWANDMVLLCCGQATAAFRTCSMAKTEPNTAISMIAQIWNVCIVGNSMYYELSIYINSA